MKQNNRSRARRRMRFHQGKPNVSYTGRFVKRPIDMKGVREWMHNIDIAELYGFDNKGGCHE